MLSLLTPFGRENNVAGATLSDWTRHATRRRAPLPVLVGGYINRVPVITRTTRRSRAPASGSGTTRTGGLFGLYAANPKV